MCLLDLATCVLDRTVCVLDLASHMGMRAYTMQDLARTLHGDVVLVLDPFEVCVLDLGMFYN